MMLWGTARPRRARGERKSRKGGRHMGPTFTTVARAAAARRTIIAIPALTRSSRSIPSAERTQTIPGPARDLFFMRFLPHLLSNPRNPKHFRALRAVIAVGASLISFYLCESVVPPSHPRSSASIRGSILPPAATKRTHRAQRRPATPGLPASLPPLVPVNLHVLRRPPHRHDVDAL